MKYLVFILFCLPNFLSGQLPSYLDNYTDVEKVMIGKDGYWVATVGGLLLYDSETGILCDIFNRSNSPLKKKYKINLDKAGRLYVSIELLENYFLVYKYDQATWELLDTDNTIEANELVFDENNNYFPAAQLTYEVSSCGDVWVGNREVFNGVDGETYAKNFERFCSGSSSGCGCGPSYLEFQKFVDGSFVSMDVSNGGGHYTSYYNNIGFNIDADGNFWVLDDNVFYTSFFNGQSDETARDTILSDTTYILLGINSDNKFKLYKMDDGFYLYDGQTFEPVTTTFPLTIGVQYNTRLNPVVWNDDNQIVVLSNQRQAYVYLDDQWKILESPFPFNLSISDKSFIDPYYDRYKLYNIDKETEILNAKGSATWISSRNYSLNEAEYSLETEYLLITEEGYQNFNSENSPLPNRLATLKNGDVDNQIWLFYGATADEPAVVLNYNGEEWLVLDETETGNAELSIDKIEVDALGTLWFLNEDAGFVASYNEQTNWQNHNNLDSYNTAFASVTKWNMLADNSIQKTVNGNTTIIPPLVDGEFIDGVIEYGVVNEDGFGWLFERNYEQTDLYQQVYYFNGESWQYHSDVNNSLENIGIGYYQHQDVIVDFTSNQYQEHNLPTCRIRIGDGSMSTYVFPSVNENTDFFRYHSITVEYLGVNDDNEMHFSINRFSTSNIFPPTPGITLSKEEVYKVANGTLIKVESPIPEYDKLLIDNTNQFWWIGPKGLATIEPLANAPFQFSKQDNCDYYGNTLSVGTLQGGRYPYLYEWSDGATSPRRHGVTPGFYACTMTDDAGNVDDFDFSIDDNNQMIVEIDVTEPTMISTADGEILTTVSGGTPPYTYEWSTGSTESDLLEIVSSIYPYSVTITDAEGCEVKRVINLNLGSMAEIEILQFATCPGSNDASATVHFMNGMEMEYVFWGNSLDNLTTLYDIKPGVLKVTGIDIYGNIHTDKVIIPEPEPIIQLNISIESIDTGITLTPNHSGGTLPFQYEWSNGSTDAILENVSFGNYAVTITDANGCTASDKSIAQNMRPFNNTQSRDGKGVSGDSNLSTMIYPNPVNDILMVELGDAKTAFVTLQSQTGQVISQQNMDGRGSIDMSQLSSGIYLLTIRSGADVFTEKVVK